MMGQFGDQKSMVSLTCDLSTWSALVAEARFFAHGMSKIMAGREKFFWTGLACVGVRSTRGVLFITSVWSMNAFIKNDTMREVSFLEFIK